MTGRGIYFKYQSNHLVGALSRGRLTQRVKYNRLFGCLKSSLGSFAADTQLGSEAILKSQSEGRTSSFWLPQTFKMKKKEINRIATNSLNTC